MPFIRKRRQSFSSAFYLPNPIEFHRFSVYNVTNIVCQYIVNRFPFADVDFETYIIVWGDEMRAAKFLYLIRTIEDDKVQLAETVDIIDGVAMSDGKKCVVLKRYAQPVTMSEAQADIHEFSASAPAVAKELSEATSGEVYTDHKGNKFETLSQMCAYYKIPSYKYRYRLARGWSQEAALTTIHPEKQYTDHLGNTYGSVSHMCSVYGVRLDSYFHRKKRGWTVEEILTGKRTTKFVTDHQGNSYPSIKAMCLKYGIASAQYRNRLKAGCTVEEALTGAKREFVAYDHLGNAFPNQQKMCDHYGIRFCTFRARLKGGFTLEEALTTPVGGRKGTPEPVTDHLGNTYSSVKEMCAAHSVIPTTYRNRIRNGYTVEKALSEPRKRVAFPFHELAKIPKKPSMQETDPGSNQQDTVTDHLGNEYSSILEMCQAHGIRVDTFKYRLKHGYSLEKSLTKIPKVITHNIPCQDHLGNHYISQAQMARAYGLTKELFISRKRNGWDIERILTTPLGAKRDRSFVFNNVTYSSKKDFCEKHGLNYDSFIHRLHDGMSIEEALAAGLRTKASRRRL